MTDEFINQIPSNEALESRFSFIDNDTLRSNVVIYFRYIIFLSSLSQDEKINSLRYTLYKDIIIYTASIIESLLEYAVSYAVLMGKIDKTIMGYSQKHSQIGQVQHECNELFSSKIAVCEVKKYPKLGSTDRIDFKDITLAAKGAGILNESQYKKAENLRGKRNTIHLISLDKSSDDYFEQGDVDKAFGWAKEIIEQVENLFNENKQTS